MAVLGMAGMTLKAAPAAAAVNVPVILYCDLAVRPAQEAEFLTAYHKHFKPVARKHEGYIDLTIARLDKALQGPAPVKSFNYRFQLTWQSEVLRQKWVASQDHVRNWPLLEKTLADKDFTVLLTHTV